MPEQRQIVVQAVVAPNKAKGARKDANMQSIYSASPIYGGELTDEERRAAYQDLALDGVVNGGHGTNSFDRDYSGAPDISQVETGGGGLPASPYIPNLTSPGPGSISATDQPVFNGDLPSEESNVEFGSGLGGTASPVESSKNISEQTIIGNYISGRSYEGSNG
jgi:hypothetical protein